ncbi:MAG: ribosome maturation factor RimM [Cyanobacteria bacterium J06606_4]
MESKVKPNTNSPTNTAPDSDEEWVLIGRIVGAHGLNGHVKVYPESDFPERFITPGDRWLQKVGGKPERVRLTSGRYLEGKNNYLVKLAGVDFRDQAEDLRSAQLMVPASDRLPLDPGEFHVNDLIGLLVILQADGTELGTVSNIFTTGHDLLEVTLADSEPSTSESSPTESTQSAPDPSLRAKAAQKLRRKEKRAKKKKKPKTLLVPFVEEIVPVVDIAAGRIEITPPPGLIDL